MFKIYRTITSGEQIVVGVDTASGLNDYVAAHFMSKKHLDIPWVYHSPETITVFTNKLAEALNKIYDTTGKRPIVAYERNNGSNFEMDRLAAMNRENKYEIFKMPEFGKQGAGTSIRLGWDTNTATRPIMLQDLKDAVDKMVITIYDKPTINEMFAFVKVQTTNRWKAQAESGAHDDCFTRGTMILTEDGNRPIEDIKVGDFVMTRKGFRPVVFTRSRMAKVIKKIGLTGTPEHPVITKNGEVDLKNIKDSDILYIWNEKQLSIEERSITDTQAPKENSTECTSGDMISGRNHHSRCTGKFGLTSLVRYLKDILCTIKMTIPSTMNQKTLNVFLEATTLNNICEHPKEENYHLITPKDLTISTDQRKRQTARSVVRSLLTLVCGVLGSVRRYVKVGIGGKERVYNLQVAEVPEYFANNILVHNCIMALAITFQLYQRLPQDLTDIKIPKQDFDAYSLE